MFERFTEPARRCLFVARSRTVERDGDAISGEDLVGGMLVAAPDALAALVSHPTESLTPPETMRAFLRRLEANKAFWADRAGRQIPFSAAVKQAIERAVQEADALGQRWVRPEHLLAALLREPESAIARTLLDSGITLAQVRLRLAGFSDQDSPTADHL